MALQTFRMGQLCAPLRIKADYDDAMTFKVFRRYQIAAHTAEEGFLMVSGFLTVHHITCI
jgi:hypothetical protein